MAGLRGACSIYKKNYYSGPFSHAQFDAALFSFFNHENRGDSVTK
jgi:hypothetical protein